ncbi:MAG: hypothetical protein PHG08_05580 [Bacilli bacterium]|nr:hypothetical protein [Bacilli bacterium]HHU24585.1 hypothetical protein [Acholeplasmataceae bacterium]
MYILIGEDNQKMKKFMKSLNDYANLISMPCELANVPKGSIVLIPFSRVLDNGVIEGTKIFIEEILISPKVKKIIFGNSYNQKMLEKLCFAYHIECQFK